MLPCPQCGRCGLQVPNNRLNNRHYNSDICRKGIGRKERREASQRMYEAGQERFQVNGNFLTRVSAFKCLGRDLVYNNSDWLALYRNLKKAQKRWGMVSRVLVRDGATTRAMGMFYKGIVQAVLLCGCETWTVTPRMMKVLAGFHNKIARRISGRQPRKVNGEWHYPPLENALKESSLFPVREHVRRRQATVARYIATRPIYQRCTAAQRRPGSASRVLRWWEQNHSAEAEGDDAAEEDDDELEEDADDNGDGDEED